MKSALRPEEKYMTDSDHKWDCRKKTEDHSCLSKSQKRDVIVGNVYISYVLHVDNLEIE